MNIKHIIDNAKFYKNIADTQIPNIESIKRALEVVKQFIIGKGLILYGGMAIDFALKYYGHKGVYGPEVLPDYDFYSPDNINDSMQIASMLHDRGYNEVTVINGLHLITRRVRINKRDLVADVSYYAAPYYARIPVLNVGINIVHPYFQLIDLHRSLSHLHEGIQGREYYRHRLQKDIKRLNILIKNIPRKSLNDLHRQVRDARPIEGNYLITLLARSDKTKHKITPGVCYTGIIALAIICRECEYEFPQKIKANSIKIPGPAEYFVDNPTAETSARFFNKTFDIFPEAIFQNDTVIYDNYGDYIAASKIGDIYVCSVQQLMATFLFKYIMTGNIYNWECYEICCDLINFDPEGPALAEESVEKKKAQFKNLDKSPLTINGEYYGSANFNITWLYGEKKENCVKEKKSYKPRPELKFVPGKKTKQKPSKYITYIVDGSERPDQLKKTTDCDV